MVFEDTVCLRSRKTRECDLSQIGHIGYENRPDNSMQRPTFLESELKMADNINVPRIVLAALKGGAGKTFITVGLAAALRRRGLSLAMFKKGPDYIDAGWLGLAAGCNCYNLDAYLFEQDVVTDSFLKRCAGSQAALIEGNRGLFDGVDSMGRYSTAELAKLLKAPVIIIVDATKMTRTAAALVLGCKVLDPDLAIQGVILNRVGGARHEKVLGESIENVCSIPVLGSVGKIAVEHFPQRHLGVLPSYEHPQAQGFLEEAADVVERSVDLDCLLEIASCAEVLAPRDDLELFRDKPALYAGLKIGVLKDSAFQFYYPENLEVLSATGAELVEISALEPMRLPPIDALYIGGGFPETHAGILAQNSVFKESIRDAVEGGLPVYAECGGLMYLSKSLRIDDRVYPMVGVFPVDTVLERKPQGHGYIHVEVSGINPFFQIGTSLTGHEFHYSYVTPIREHDASYAFKVLRGHGMDGMHDGICKYNALGTYVHLHALGAPLWADGILALAKDFSKGLNKHGKSNSFA